MKILKALGKPFTALAGKVDSAVEQKILMSLARHGATALGGYLVAKGVLDMGHTEMFIGGLLAIVGAVSGSKQKVDAQ
jgi:hypothetical protein